VWRELTAREFERSILLLANSGAFELETTVIERLNGNSAVRKQQTATVSRHSSERRANEQRESRLFRAGAGAFNQRKFEQKQGGCR
jgi:hypothetical protein